MSETILLETNAYIVTIKYSINFCNIVKISYAIKEFSQINFNLYFRI